MSEKHEWLDPDNEQEEAVRHLVENTDLSPLQAKELVAEHGTDREKLLKIARTMKAEG
jgi:putative SOS response-associated peptidase YedK